MKSAITSRFRDAYRALPESARRQTRKSHKLLLHEASYPSLVLKKVGEPDVYSARVGMGHRALGWLNGDTITWFWIGTHAEYDKLI